MKPPQHNEPETQSGDSPQSTSFSNNDTTKSNKNEDVSTETMVRETVGKGMITVSDAINENLVAARFATFATLSLLTAYGLSNTALFFRFKTVAEIPGRFFSNRKRLRARLIKTEDNDQAGQPIICYVRHLSPMGQLLSRDLFDFVSKAAPSAQVTKNKSDLLKVEIAGLSAPPFYSSHDYQRGEWLRRLAEDKTKVSVQLLGRREMDKTASTASSSSSSSNSKRDVTAVLPELQSSLDSNTTTSNPNNPEEEQIVVGRLYYRPSLFQLFSTDLADPLVRYGHACVESEIFMKNQHTQNSKITDCNSGIETLRKDVNYLNRIEKLEYEAAKGSYGMWSDATIRDKRRDIVEEVEFQTTATVWQRLWRWMRG